MSILHERLTTNWYICTEKNCPYLSQIIISTKLRQDRTLYRIRSPMNISWQTHWKQQTSIFNQVTRQCTQTVAILTVSRIHRDIREFSLNREERVWPPWTFIGVWISETVFRGGPVKSTDVAEYKKLRGMRKPVDDVDETGLGAEVVSRAGDDHDRYRQLSASSREDPFAGAAR